MQSIILTKNKAEGQKLQKIMASLNSQCQGMACFDKLGIQSDIMKFRDTQCIFSTWYMPKFTEEEIRNAFPSLKAVFYAAGTVKYFAEPFLKAGVRVFSSAKAN